VKPREPSSTATMPFLAAWPECSGLVMVPKFDVTPDASDAVMPIMSGIAAAGTFISRAQAAATAMVPTVPVVCQPPIRDRVGAARDMRAQTSAPMMNAASMSDGEASVVSATGRIAGIRPAID
jgi:hypothetical protein